MQSLFSSSVAFKQNYITIFWRNFEPKSEVDCKALYAQAGLNPKHEMRNSKQSQMLKFQMSQTKEFREFEFWKFKFVSDFDIRISDFSTPKPVWSRLCRVKAFGWVMSRYDQRSFEEGHKSTVCRGGMREHAWVTVYKAPGPDRVERSKIWVRS